VRHYPGSAPWTALVSEPPTVQDSVTQTVVFNNLMTLDPPSIEELMRWSTQLYLLNGRDVCPKVPDMIIGTDASLTGWGQCATVCAQGGCGI